MGRTWFRELIADMFTLLLNEYIESEESAAGDEKAGCNEQRI